MCVIKINLAPARFELGTFCLERILNKFIALSHNPCYILCYSFSYLKNIYIYIYIINK